MKLFFDFFIALSLIIILLPIYILIGTLILFDSGFPLIHRRKVHLKSKKMFHFYKFRTMYPDADERLKEILKKDKSIREEYNKYYKIKNDPRITKLGSFLRRTSLDEIPQLFNVLFGQMSLVGPRPKTPNELIKYFDSELHNTLFKVKPGITCTWQISGRSDVSYEKRVELDLDYAKNRNVLLDTKILFFTMFALFKKGAR